MPKYSKEILKIYSYNPLVRNCSTVNLLEISLLVRKVINILQTLFKRNHVYYGIQTIYYLPTNVWLQIFDKANDSNPWN